MADFKNRLTTTRPPDGLAHGFPRQDLSRRPAPLRPASHQAISAYPAANPDRLPPLEQHLARPTQSCLPCIRPIPSLHRRIHPREAFSSTVALLPTLQTRPSITLNQPHPTTATPASNRFHQVRPAYPAHPRRRRIGRPLPARPVFERREPPPRPRTARVCRWGNRGEGRLTLSRS